MFSAVRTAGARVLDNAMLYKDITQWLRNRTFLVLFFGLLLGAEAISMFIMGMGEELEEPGNIVFSILFGLLILYGFIIAFMGHLLTGREFQNRTFELYELSGMSLERMIGGKFLSMAYQFLFGFFCIVPFMFFAYFLGGLDFINVLSGAALAMLFVPPAYLLALLTALTTKLRQIAALGRIAALGLVVVFGFILFESVMERRFLGGMVFEGMSELIKAIMAGNTDAMGGVAVFLLFYLQLCLLLFYLCCHMISRETDSREVEIKALCFTLLLSWLALIGFFQLRLLGRHEHGFVAFVFIPPFILLCVSSLLMFFNSMRIPVIVRNRYRDAKGLRKFMYAWFQPGPMGLWRYLIAQIGLCFAFVFFIWWALESGWIGMHRMGTGYARTITGAEMFYDWLRAVSYVAQIPFFVAVPIGFITAFFPKVRENVAIQRTLVACFWGFGGAVVSFYALWHRYHRGEYREILDFLAMVTSPISSIVVTTDGSSPMYGTFGVEARVILGLLGIYLMHGILRRRRRDAVADGSVGNTQSSLVQSGAPV